EESVMVRNRSTLREKVIYPGYLYFEAENDITADTIKTISQYEGVMSMMKEKLPIKLRDRDTIRILMDDKLSNHQNSLNNEFKKADAITITQGPFKTFKGVVTNITEEG